MRENIIRYEQPNKQNRCKTLKHTTVRRLAAQVVPFSPSTFKLVVVVYPPLFPTARSLYLRYSLSAVCCCAAWQFVYTCVCPRVTFSPHPSLTLLCLWAIFTIVSTQKQELLSCSTLIQKHRLIYPTFHVWVIPHLYLPHWDKITEKKNLADSFISRCNYKPDIL